MGFWDETARLSILLEKLLDKTGSHTESLGEDALRNLVTFVDFDNATAEIQGVGFHQLIALEQEPIQYGFF